MFKRLTMLKGLFLGLFATASLSAAPLDAPDTGDLTSTIVNYGGAAIAVAIAYMLWPVAVKAIKLIRSAI